MKVQFEDYSKYAADMFDVGERNSIYENRFPADLQKAFEMGARLVEK
ncbi:hypothetical protein [Alkalibacter mobilis]|nr:hypothetical protein [Alkalibacter mobilis]MBF7097497.1 hypothetical protein [Alkalibacter mobilis]